MADQSPHSDPAPKYEYSRDGKTVTWVNRDRMPKVAAQAGDEPIKRYELTYRDDFNNKHGADVDEADDGQWVRFSDIEHLIVSPRATADVERDAEIAKVVWQLISDGVLDHVLSGSDESGHEESFGSDTEEMAYLIASIKSARTRIATTKPGA